MSDNPQKKPIEYLLITVSVGTLREPLDHLIERGDSAFSANFERVAESQLVTPIKADVCAHGMVLGDMMQYGNCFARVLEHMMDTYKQTESETIKRNIN